MRTQTATAISASLASNNSVASSVVVATQRRGPTNKGKQWNLLTHQTHAQPPCSVQLVVLVLVLVLVLVVVLAH